MYDSFKAHLDICAVRLVEEFAAWWFVGEAVAGAGGIIFALTFSAPAIRSLALSHSGRRGVAGELLACHGQGTCRGPANVRSI